MPVVFSRACEYALRALFEMARHPEQQSWTVQDLAARTDTPAPFLAKTFQALVKEEILSSTKGRKGGFAFARKPGKIFLMEIVDAIDGSALTHDCALGMPTCNDDNPCPFHRYWKGIRANIMTALRHEPLSSAALAEAAKPRGKPPSK
jgi:Rrf2 family protein